MDFGWTEEQVAYRHRATEFARKELNHDLAARDKEGRFPYEQWKRCADFGIQGMPMPSRFGGQDLPILTSMLAMEGLGYGCRDHGLLLALNAQIWVVQLALAHFGSEEQRRKFLPGLCAGDLIGAQALTEPEAGSDVYHMQTRAEKRPGGYQLNGRKTLITLGPIADVALVFATLNPDLGQWGITAFLVEKGTPGFKIGGVREKMGLRTVPLGDLIFEDCFVPDENRLGPEGAGIGLSNSLLEWERGCMLASQLGAMEFQLDQSIAQARERRQFGQAIGKFQSVSNRIANMKLRLESARWLTYRVGWLKHVGRTATLEAALAKLCLTEGFVESSVDAIRIHGGRGYLSEFEVERDLRDAMGGVIYGGTSDIQRNVVAGLLGL